MATAGTYSIGVTDSDTQDVREMKMMRFIFALPIINIKILRKHEQACGLCEQPYNPEWKINNSETAVILPCGHVFGHFCIRKWLSPFEIGRTRCPRSWCGTEFPCPMNRLVSNGQSIIGGRLYPNPPPMVTENENSSDGDDEYEEDEVDSVSTEDIVSELADDSSAQDMENEDPIRQIRAITPSVDADEECENMLPKECGKESSSRLAEGEVPKTKALSKWALVRNMFWTLDAYISRNSQGPVDQENLAI